MALTDKVSMVRVIVPVRSFEAGINICACKDETAELTLISLLEPGKRRNSAATTVLDVEDETDEEGDGAANGFGVVAVRSDSTKFVIRDATIGIAASISFTNSERNTARSRTASE